MNSSTRARLAFASAAIEAALCALTACGSQTPAAGAASTSTTDAGPDVNVNVQDASSPPPDAADADTYVEAPLTIEMSLAIALPDAGSGSSADAGGSGGVDGGADGAVGDAGPDAAAETANLTITARDGVTPVITDLWLYTLDPSGGMTPLTGFTSTAQRKTPRRMLPATIGGQPSGLSPADDGEENGVMTGTSRGVLDQGAFVSTVNGTVVVTLPSAPTAPILVVAGVEDQRYAGAAVIQPDGSPGTVPAGVGAPETHTRRSFQDVAAILQANCTLCHNPTGPDNAEFYLVTGSRDDLVNDNFALKEQTQDCQEKYPDGGDTLAACVQAITQAQFLVEPGAPAVSDLLQRARPDEDAGTSALGLAWYGSKGNRYNATYGDRRMPSTTQSTDPADWTNAPAYFDAHPAEFQVLYDWVAQGALP